MHSSTCFGAYLYIVGTEHGNLHQLSVTTSRVTILFCRPTQEPKLATANTGKTREIFGKNEGEWTGKEETRKKSLAIGEA